MADNPAPNPQTAPAAEADEEAEHAKPPCLQAEHLSDEPPLSCTATSVSLASSAAPNHRLLDAAKGIKRIVEEIDGSMNHGTWRDDRGNRLKDTPEWVEFYLSLEEASDAG
jgi:hypothetical protein